MGAPAAGSGPGAAGPAARAARAPGGCRRASGSSTSSRSRSARAPWRCTTPSRSSRTASPSTARSSSSARTTSSANTPSASPSGHILRAGPGGRGLPRARARVRRRVRRPRPAGCGGAAGPGPGGGSCGAQWPSSGPGGGCDPGAAPEDSAGGGGAGLRASAAAGACARARGRGGSGWTLGGAPCPGHVPSLPAGCRAHGRLEGAEGERVWGASPGAAGRSRQQVRRVCGLSGHACSRARVGTCGYVCRWQECACAGSLSSPSGGRTATSLRASCLRAEPDGAVPGAGGAVRGADGAVRGAGGRDRKGLASRQPPKIRAEGEGALEEEGALEGLLSGPWRPPGRLPSPWRSGRSLTHALPSST